MLKQYRVKELDDLVPPATNSNINTEYDVGNNDNSFQAYSAREQLQSVGDPINFADNFTMYNEFLTTMPEMEGYDQLFADLDYYCGPI